jgi:HlyD family secretion protein
MKKRVGILVPVALVAGLAVWWFGIRQQEAAGLTASGTVEATQADLGFQIPGRVDRITVREGEAVEAGRILATLSMAELEARLAGAEAQRDAARARLAELERGSRTEEVAAAEAAEQAARDRLEEANREAERAGRLYEGGAMSQRDHDRATTAARVARSTLEQAQQHLTLLRRGPRDEQVAAQEAVLRQADAAVTAAKANIDNATVRAPFAGVITDRHREPGESVGAGAPVLTLRNMDDRWVRIYVREDRIGRVKIGEGARIHSDSHPGRTYDGEVVFIGSEAEFTPRNVQTTEERVKLVYAVKVRIVGDPDMDLRPGVPADVELASASGG